MRLDERIQGLLPDCLGNAISARRHPKQPLATLLLGDGDYLDWRGEVTSRGPPIPEFVEVVFQLRLKRFDRLPIYPGGTMISFHLLIGCPHRLFGNTERLC